MRRYSDLHRTIRALQFRITAEATAILQPHFERAREALATEYARRYEIAEPILSNKKNNPIVKECVRWMDAADTIDTSIHGASDASQEYDSQSLLDGWTDSPSS